MEVHHRTLHGIFLQIPRSKWQRSAVDVDHKPLPGQSFPMVVWCKRKDGGFSMDPGVIGVMFVGLEPQDA